MWYGMCRFSLEPFKNIFGPFKTEEGAWNYIENASNEEYNEDRAEYGIESTITKDKEFGEITIETVFSSGEIGTSLYCIFEIENS